MSKQLYVYCPFPQDATSYYRGMGVMADLQRKFNGKLEIQYRRDGEAVKLWNTFDFADVLFVQRPASPELVQMMQYFKEQYNRPVWIDFDDNLFELPKYNRAFKVYDQQTTKDNVIKSIQLADVITVTTEELKRYISPMNPNVIVVPNAFNNATFDLSRRKNIERQNSVLWRGSDTHIGDVDYYHKEIQAVMADYPDHKFLFVGSDINGMYHIFDEAFNRNMMGNAHRLEPLDPNIFLNSIQALGSKFIHVPLVDNLFNRAKSNIAMIEGAWAGMAVIAPDWKEWQLPGVLNYNSPGDYYNLMSACLSGAIDYKAKAAETWQYVSENLTLTKVNMLRYKILKELL